MGHSRIGFDFIWGGQVSQLTEEVGGVVPGDPGEVLQLRVVLLVLVSDGDELGERHEVVRGPLLVPAVLRRRDVDLRHRRPRPRPDLGLELQVGQLGEGPDRSIVQGSGVAVAAVVRYFQASTVGSVV